jgi:putative hemin transport protein
MIREPDPLRNEWMRRRAAEKGLHALDIAERLGVTECELLASACGGASSEVSATRLSADWETFLTRLPKLGVVKTVTRNPQAVIEVEGTYDHVEFFGAMGQSVSTIDLRIFVNRWKHGFMVSEETKRGVSRGFQFFDAYGRAIHKLYLREQSDVAFFDVLVREHTSADQARSQAVDPPPTAIAMRPDSEIDVPGLRDAWGKMTNTHEFFMLLRKFEVARTQALRLAGEELAYPVRIYSLEALLHASAGTDRSVMVFVGNPGVIQIYSGPIKKVAVTGEWINVLDPGFNLHVRKDQIEEAWVVRKPTSEGVITSLELYAENGEQIAHVVGKRKPGEDESEAWRTTVESLPRQVMG